MEQDKFNKAAKKENKNLPDSETEISQQRLDQIRDLKKYIKN